jgi:hypothetical protein
MCALVDDTMVTSESEGTKNIGSCVLHMACPIDIYRTAWYAATACLVLIRTVSSYGRSTTDHAALFQRLQIPWRHILNPNPAGSSRGIHKRCGTEIFQRLFRILMWEIMLSWFGSTTAGAAFLRVDNPRLFGPAEEAYTMQELMQYLSNDTFRESEPFLGMKHTLRVSTDGI